MNSFDPYYLWLAIGPDEQPPHYYRLLGLAPLESNLDAVRHAVHRQIGFLKLQLAGPHKQDAVRLLDEITSARECLLNAKKKSAYDNALRGRIHSATAQAASAGRVVQSPQAIATLSPLAQPPSAPPISAQPLGVGDRYVAHRTYGNQWVKVLIGGGAGMLCASIVILLGIGLFSPRPAIDNSTPTKSGNPIDSQAKVSGETPSSQSSPLQFSGEDSAPLIQNVRTIHWKKGEPAKDVLPEKNGFCFLSKVSGNFRGFGETIGVNITGNDDYWRLFGKSKQRHLAGEAVAVTTRLRLRFQMTYETFHWRRGQKPIKMIPRRDGLCFLSEVSGSFMGGGEEVRVHLGNNDHWFLTGRSGQRQLAARAVCIRALNPGGFDAEVREHVWRRGAWPIKMISKTEGFCFLSGVGGRLGGPQHSVRVYVGEDDHWYLSGEAGGRNRSILARAVSVRFRQ